MTAESNPPARRGCLFYFLVILVVGTLLLLLATGIAVYSFKKVTTAWVQDYTDTMPAPIEKVEYTPDQVKALQGRWLAFQEGLDKKQAGELILSAEDLNAFIHEDPNLRGRVFVYIDGSRLKGDVSMPLDQIGPLRVEKLKGRYLNGTVSFSVATSNGLLEVHLEDVKVKARPLPSLALSELRKQNLAEGFMKNPEAARRTAQLDSVTVTNGQVILRSKP